MIPTAEEFVNQYDWENSTLNIPDVLIEFAKLHVKKALEEAVERAVITYDRGVEYVDKDSILNAYPLTNIK